ncbi:MAG: phosphatidylinositol-3-phosphatase [Actinomycetota bacterium]|jgi:hypothetical protein|nr:phosphatidylinositol-3-phosphatase [Actinomycetota bacterium]
MRFFAVTLLVTLAACSSAPPAHVAEHDSVPPLGRVAIIVLENHEYHEVIGSPEAPYLNALADQFGYSSAMYGITHPSLPNYLALLGGSTFGIDSNCTDCTIDAPNLVDQLEKAGISWKAYMEDMPQPCFHGDNATYVKRHNPFLYFSSISNDEKRCGKVVPLEHLYEDLAGGTLPRFTWVTPGLCSDSHDCSISTSDRFLSAIVPPLLDALGREGVLFITYDEGTSSEGCCDVASGGRIPFVVAGGAAQAGKDSEDQHTLYSVLRTIEEGFGLPLLERAGCDCTSTLGDLLAR